MNDYFNQRSTKEKLEEMRKDAEGDREFRRNEKLLKFPTSEITKILDILLPQQFDSVVNAIRAALSQIDPSWGKGQFDVFSKHFRLQFWRSVFIKRFLLNEAKVALISEDRILEAVLHSAKSMDETAKAAFYGTVLSEYVLRCPIERFPLWADEQKSNPNWLAHWNLHSDTWHNIYW